MELGMVGLGRMGRNMAARLVAAGQRVQGHDPGAESAAQARADGVPTVGSLAELVAALPAPRAVWLMVPVGKPVEETVEALAERLAPGDLVVDGGNSYYQDSVRRAARLAEVGVEFVDAGTSGGVWGRELGYCLMLGGGAGAVARLRPALDALAPPGGWRHVGAAGAGHFVKMVHNAIEYGMLQAYAEGFELLHDSDYEIDLAEIASLWNQGGVVRSWLLELTERALREDPGLGQVTDYTEDSGMGRWAVLEGVERAVPTPVIAVSLMSRFRSRQEQSFAGKVVAALRHQFGGHAVREQS